MRASAVGLALLVMWAGVAAGQVYRPEVPIALVAHEGEPVPGIPDATFDGFAPPKIDAQGNVLLVASMSGPGIDDSNDVAMWFGQPDGARQTLPPTSGSWSVGLGGICCSNRRCTFEKTPALFCERAARSLR